MAAEQPILSFLSSPRGFSGIMACFIFQSIVIIILLQNALPLPSFFEAAAVSKEDFVVVVGNNNDRQQNYKRIDIQLEKEKAINYLKTIKSLDRKLIFFHIPKTAGTAIENAAGAKHIPWGSCLFRHKPKRDICRYPEGKDWPLHVGYWHVPSQFFPIGTTNPYHGAELFGVVRDTYDRMVSEFYYICTLKVFDWRPDQCDRSKLFDKAYMNTWLQKKLRDRDRQSALGYLTDNGHFTPQYEFVVGPHQVRMLDYVLTLSDSLPGDFERLVKAFGLNMQLKKQNALGAEARNATTHLGVDDLETETIQMIHELYPHDFELGFVKRAA